MIVTATLSEDGVLTNEQIQEIENAKKFPITFDEDSPELTPEMEKAFKEFARMRKQQKA
jgi:outer membrane protein OmpA-like peptidoglycan-associated protein